jgi:hypothetical protein
MPSHSSTIGANVRTQIKKEWGKSVDKQSLKINESNTAKLLTVCCTTVRNPELNLLGAEIICMLGSGSTLSFSDWNLLESPQVVPSLHLQIACFVFLLVQVTQLCYFVLSCKCKVGVHGSSWEFI